MQKTLKNHFLIGETSITPEPDTSWPFRLKLTTDHLRWDSLKISPSDGFEQHIIANLDETNRKLLDARRSIEIRIIDVDINETYKVNLVKKESFWFEPLPDVRGKKPIHCRSKSFPKVKCCYKPAAMEQDPIHLDMTNPNPRENFAYSVEPFRHIVKKRNLSYDHEIGLRCSGNKDTIKYEFSVLYAPKMHRFTP